MKITRNKKIDVWETIKYHREEIILVGLVTLMFIAMLVVLFTVAFPK